MKSIYFSIIGLLFLLCSCSKSAPDAYVIKAGMTRAEVAEALETINIYVYVDDDDYSDEHPADIDIDKKVDYLGVNWDSFNISFNKQGLVDKVSFYLSDGGYLNKYSLIDELSKELGEASGGGTFTTWSVENKWLVSFTDNNSPYPKCLVYWYEEYMDPDEPQESESE